MNSRDGLPDLRNAGALLAALISVLTSLAASADRPAKLRTSLATTAKPRPCSPARAASTAAFSARMSVWNAMPSMTLMMSAIFLELSLMPFIVLTTWPTTAPPWMATVDAPSASWLACLALSAFCLTVAPSCSIDAAVSSRALACCSVRWLRSWLPWAISALALATLSALLRTRDTVVARPDSMSCRAASMPPIGPMPKGIEPRLRCATVAPAVAVGLKGAGASLTEARSGTRRLAAGARARLAVMSDVLGWLMGLEPTTTRITIWDSTN